MGMPLAAALFVAACGDDRPMASYPVRVARPGDAPASIVFDYQGGYLELTAAPQEDLLLLEARSDRPEMRPAVETGRAGERAVVRVHQPRAEAVRGKRSRNEWRASLCADHPAEVSVDAGVLGAAMRLGGARIDRIDVEAAQGDVTVDLSDGVVVAVDVVVQLGHGTLTVIVPDGVPARVRARDAVGRIDVEGIPEREEGVYQDPSFDDADPRVDLALGVMTGWIRVERREPGTP